MVFLSLPNHFFKMEKNSIADLILSILILSRKEVDMQILFYKKNKFN